MSYQYKTEKHEVFTESGQVMFLKIRDRAHQLLKEAGCFRMEEVMRAAPSGSSWTMLACVDRLVELGEIREIPQSNVWEQHRIFTAR